MNAEMAQQDWLVLDATIEHACEEARYAYEQQPAFRTHLEAAGLAISEISDRESFARIPQTGKAHYRSNFPAGIVAASTPLDHPLVVHSQSSGTGGDRLETVAYSYDLADRMFTALSVNPPLKDALLSLRGANVTRFAPPNCSEVECAAPLATMADRTLPNGALVLPVAHDLLATPPRMVDQIIDEIATYQPAWIDADSTHLAYLLRHYAERGLAPPAVQAIMLSYTLSTGVARRQIREAFPGVPTAEVLMMTEFGYVAVECPAGNMHLNAKSFYTELVRDGEHIRPGELGELVCTSLRDRLLPHIRYGTGDVYRLLGDCDCGFGSHDLPAVCFEGRWRHMMCRDGEIRLTPRGLDELVGDNPALDVYRLSQIQNSHFRFQYIGSRIDVSSTDALRDALVAALGGGLLRLDFERVDHIATDRTGKFVSCICLMPDADKRGRTSRYEI